MVKMFELLLSVKCVRVNCLLDLLLALAIWLGVRNLVGKRLTTLLGKRFELLLSVKCELCRLITRLDLPLGIGESQAWEDYIVLAHNPRFAKVSRHATTIDLGKLFTEYRDMLKNFVLPAASSVALTLDI